MKKSSASKKLAMKIKTQVAKLQKMREQLKQLKAKEQQEGGSSKGKTAGKRKKSANTMAGKRGRPRRGRPPKNK